MRVPKRSADHLSIGVAVMIPEPYRAVLAEARRSVGDPAAPFVPPHITLLNPTAVGVEDVETIEKHLAEVAACHAPFVVGLRGTGTFRPVSPVVFVQVVDGTAACASIERQVRTGPLTQDLRFSYHPHVTIAHEVPDAALDQAFEQLADFEVSFPVTEFHSFEFGQDEVWRPVRDYRLGSPAV